jgi:hypothetical protein
VDARPATLIEIMSGHPYVRSDGSDDGKPSHETLWQEALDHDRLLFGVAVDDAHHFSTTKTKDKPALPARAFIETFTTPGADVDTNKTCDAIRSGHFYASNGALFDRIRVQGDEVALWPKDKRARVFFIGRGGETLSETTAGDDGSARYRLRGDEPWVRARIEEVAGPRAWTQPFLTKPR